MGCTSSTEVSLERWKEAMQWSKVLVTFTHTNFLTLIIVVVICRCCLGWLSINSSTSTTTTTKVVTDPYTGQEKEKKKWGGAYPGNRPPQHAPYTPDANQFNPVTNQATSHFVSYGGGNALVLTNGPKPNSSSSSGGKPQFVQGNRVTPLSRERDSFSLLFLTHTQQLTLCVCTNSNDSCGRKCG